MLENFSQQNLVCGRTSRLLATTAFGEPLWEKIYILHGVLLLFGEVTTTLPETFSNSVVEYDVKFQLLAMLSAPSSSVLVRSR